MTRGTERGGLPAISLFSGAGGLDLGLQAAGYDVRVAIERDPDCCTTIRAAFPHTAVIEGDIRSLSTPEILEVSGLRNDEVALVAGGPPCTPFSKSGYWLETKRNGQDPEADLVGEFVRVVAEIRPESFLFENVPGLAYRHPNRRWLDELESALESLGYHVTRAVLLAADFGVPQRRQRLFLTGSVRRRVAPPSPTHAGPHERRRRQANDLPSHVAVGAVIGDLAERDDLREEDEEVGGKYGHLLPDVPPGENYLHFTAERGHPRPLFRWRSRYWSFLLKLHPEKPSPTIQAQPGPYVGPFHWENRRLRLPEVMRLQGLPDGFPIAGTRRSAQRQVGNAVPPLLAERVADPLARLARGESLIDLPGSSQAEDEHEQLSLTGPAG